MKTLLTSIILLIMMITIDLDAKKEWVFKHYKTYEGYKSIKCIDDRNCLLLVDSIGNNIIKLYRSKDGGDTWEAIYRKDPWSPELSYRSPRLLEYVDINNVYIAYSHGQVLDISKDGGKTFDTFYFRDSTKPYNHWIKEFSMFTDSIGVAISVFDMFITKDNWVTYDSISLGEEDYHMYDGVYISYFIDSNNIALNDWPYGHSILKYSIKDSTWSTYFKGEENPDRETQKDMIETFFINDTLGYATGGQYYDKGDLLTDIIWKTTNRGKDWEIKLDSLNEADPNVGVRHISFKDEYHGIVTGPWGRVIETTDGGETWEYIGFLEEASNNLFAYEIAWAGDYPIIAAQGYGVYRREEVGDTTNIPIIESKNIHIRQRKDELIIAIKDEYHRNYEINIYDLQGNLKQRNELNSGRSKIYQPINISSLNTGMYLFRISVRGQSVQTGKFVIDK